MKSKIEQKIEKAREATNEMFAAFDELNESLKEKEPEKWVPKDGEYATIKYNYNGGPQQYICIIKNKLENLHSPYAVIDTTGRLHINRMCAFDKGGIVCPSNPQEKQLLDDKLKESGKRFDKEKLELVEIPKFKVGDWFIPHKPKENKTNVFWAKEMDEFDGVVLQVSEPKFKNAEGIYSEVADWHFHPDWCEKTTAPKHKEPIIGEMAIFWDTDKSMAFCAILIDKDNFRYHDNTSTWRNAILYESIEQYKAFLKS